MSLDAVFLDHLEEPFAAEVLDLVAALRRQGLWRPAALAHILRGDDLAEVESVLLMIMGKEADDDIDILVPYFLQAVHAARRELASRHRGIMQNGTWELAAAAHARALQDERDLHEGFFRARQLQAARASIPPPNSRFRSTVIARAAAAHEGDPHGREKAEAEYRDKMLAKLARVMEHDNLDAGAVRLVAAGRRASTLDARLRAWAAFQRWLVQVGGRHIPLTTQDCVDYLAARAEEPCGRGTLRGIIAMIGFWDDVNRRQGSERWSRDKSIQDAFNEYSSGVTMRAGGARAVKALRPSVGILESLELVVVDSGSAVVDRVLAWYLLVASWGTLRFDDHRGWSRGAGRRRRWLGRQPGAD